MIAYRHLFNTSEAIIVNSNLGGDTTNRGALLGTIMGLINYQQEQENQDSKIKQEWLKNMYGYEQVTEPLCREFAMTLF